jgi:hypothetical protein
MKKLLVLFIAIVAGFTTVAAQSVPDMKFKDLVHDFGTFPEETGKVTCSFEFTNTGKSDLIIQNVKASCGCTTPDWTKTPVKPGEKGFVEATYNATGRPGAFNKQITVTTSAGEERLTIKGEVTPKPPKVEDQYPFDMNGLRVKTLNVYMNNVEYPAQKTERIEVINTTSQPIALSFKGAPSYLTVKASPATLKANEKGTIDVTIDPKAAKDWGTVNPKFTVVLNGKPVDDKNFEITVFANIVENFSSMTAEQRANAPVLNVVATVKVGDLKVKTKQTSKFAVENVGKSDLLIHKASSDNNAITVVAPKAIKAGKKDEVKLQINTENMKPGKFTSRVTLVTNDPNRSVTSIVIEGEVK